MAIVHRSLMGSEPVPGHPSSHLEVLTSWLGQPLLPVPCLILQGLSSSISSRLGQLAPEGADPGPQSEVAQGNRSGVSGLSSQKSFMTGRKEGESWVGAVHSKER